MIGSVWLAVTQLTSATAMYNYIGLPVRHPCLLYSGSVNTFQVHERDNRSAQYKVGTIYSVVCWLASCEIRRDRQADGQSVVVVVCVFSGGGGGGGGVQTALANNLAVSRAESAYCHKRVDALP